MFLTNFDNINNDKKCNEYLFWTVPLMISHAKSAEYQELMVFT